MLEAGWCGGRRKGGREGGASARCHAAEADEYDHAVSQAEQLTPAHWYKIYPYLVLNFPVSRLNQVWGMDINYLPMARCSIYLAAGMDWFICPVLAWRVPSTLEGDPCVATVEEALARDVALEAFNMDQGSQFTSIEFIKALADGEIKISMKGQADRGLMTSSSGFGRLPNMKRCIIID